MPATPHPSGTLSRKHIDVRSNAGDGTCAKRRKPPTATSEYAVIRGSGDGRRPFHGGEPTRPTKVTWTTRRLTPEICPCGSLRASMHIQHFPKRSSICLFLRSAGYLKDHSLAQQTFHPVSSSFGERQLELVEFRLPLADSEAWSPEMFANRAITELACALSAWQPARWSVLVPVNFERVPARPWKPSVDSLDSFPRTKYS